MLDIVIPMAGRGSRFQKEGYTLPKPLIPVHGKPMIEAVINNIRPTCEHRFIFLCLQEHEKEYAISNELKKIVPNSQVVLINSVTEGAACTVLLAREFINNESPLMIANSDQWVDININDYLKKMDVEKADGLIMTMSANDPKWSYVRFDDSGKVIEVVEKKVVSNEATVGIYNFRKGSDFVKAADEMIKRELKVNGEYYVAPTYNQLIKLGKKIVVYNVGEEMNGMYGLGIPSDLESFLKLKVFEKATHNQNSHE